MHKAVWIFWGLAASSAVAVGQRVSYGVVVGSAVTDDFRANYESIPGPSGGTFTIAQTTGSTGFLMGGGTLEWQLTSSISVEGDGSFRELHYNETSQGPRDSIVTWEFPILGKYHLPIWSSSHRLFVEIGPSFRTAGNLNATEPSHEGVTAGVGVEFQIGHMKLSPEVRYTRWARDHTYLSIATKPDQIEMLVALSYAPPSTRHLIGDRLSLGGVIGTSLLGAYSAATVGFQDSLESFTGINVFRSGPRRVMGGLSVLVRLKGAFDAEVNAMVHPVRLDQTGTDVFSGFPAQTYSMNYSTVLWQIPAMAKYTFHSEIGGWHPFVESGLSFRIPLILSRFGAVEGAGMERHFGSFVVSPTVRYTRWQEAYPSAPLPSYAPGLKRDELDVLVGVRF